MTGLVELDTGDGPVSAYVTGSGPVVMVLQEYWGVVPQICGVADRLAAAGFRAAVPDLYDGATTDDRGEAEALMMKLDVGRACRTVEATVGLLGDGRAPAGCVGFCMGGGLALALAARATAFESVVVFYGNVPWADVTLDWTRATPPVLLHYAANDTWARPGYGLATASAIQEAGGYAELHLYPEVGHAFLDDTRPESYSADAADAAWERTLGFLQRTMTRRPGD